MKKSVYYYQRSMWLLVLFFSEINKPLLPIKEAIPFLTWLVVGFGISFGFWASLTFFFCIIFIGVLGGWIFEKMGMQKYASSNSNAQNPEIMEILETLREIKNKL